MTSSIRAQPSSSRVTRRTAMHSTRPSDAAAAGNIKVEGAADEPPRQQATVAIRQQTPISILSSAAPSPAPVEDRSQTNSMASSSTEATTPDEDVEMTNGASAGAGTAPPIDALENVGSRSRQLIQVIERLSTLGITATLSSLPKFVVIGDQSAGKSSVIEATCDITLPRSEGTCTKCPFQITTTAQQDKAIPWKCTISILHKYTYGLHYAAANNTPGSEFDRWRAMGETESYQFAVIHNKADLESTLRRAQIAVLNPDKGYHTFKDAAANVPFKDTVGFSPNIISLRIEAPNLPELSFYDLPGAIATVPDESEMHLVDFVENLLKVYVQDEKALILLACAANQDIETAFSLRILSQCKAKRRAMGVLTKPDLVDLTAARQEKFRRILLGKDYALEKGWFITRQLSQKQLDQASRFTHEQARRQENDFFATEPWSTDLASFGDRFGVPNLQNAISNELTKHILAELPVIQARVEARMDDVIRTLAQFPKKAEDPKLSVYTESRNVQEALQKQLDPDSNALSRSSFRKAYNALLKAFSTSVRGLQPDIDLTTPGYKKPIVELLDDSDEMMDSTPSKRQRTATPSRNLACSSKAKATPESTRRRKQPKAQDSPARKGGRTTFTLKMAKADFENAAGGMAGEINGEVSKAYAIHAMRGVIPDATENFIQQVRDLFASMLTETINNVLMSRQSTELFAQAQQITRELLDEIVDERKKIIEELKAAECSRAISWGKHIPQKKLQYIEDLRTRRAAQRAREHFETEEDRGVTVPPPQEQDKKAANMDWVNKTLGADPYDNEVQGLALPLAYYEMVSSSFVDLVAKQVDYGILNQYQNALPKTLKECFARNDDECAQLLAEEPQRERERLRLLAEHDRLTNALNELKDLHIAHA